MGVDTSVIVVNIGGSIMIMVVDGISDVPRLDSGELKAPPGSNGECKRHYRRPSPRCWRSTSIDSHTSMSRVRSAHQCRRKRILQIHLDESELTYRAISGRMLSGTWKNVTGNC